MNYLSILKCAISGSDLRFLEKTEISELNELISKRMLWQINGEEVIDMLESGLVNIDKTYYYNIKSGVLLLYKGLAIVTDKSRIWTDTIGAEKALVQSFYDETGWTKDDNGNYNDAIIFEDLRPFARDYINKCHTRVGRYVAPKGKYLLDAASGALQFDSYLEYSKDYQYRICVDFSFYALKECKRKLGDKSICILADMTELPIKDDSIDAFISINTIYHIPKDEQVTAIKELYRVLIPGMTGVVIYEWFKHSLWMNIALLPFRAITFIRNRVQDLFAKSRGRNERYKMLYFYAHNLGYMERNLPPFQIGVWRTIGVPFMRIYLHSWLFGKNILEWIYKMEEKYPVLCGRNGEYPLLIFKKG